MPIRPKRIGKMTGDRTAIVHVGLPKTGTTTIQETLKRNRKTLARAGILLLAPGPTSRRLPFVFCDTPERFLSRGEVWNRSPKAVERLRRSTLRGMERAARRDDWQTMLLSAEGFFNLSETGLQALRAWLDGHVGTIRVIAWVRHPVSHTRSAIQEILKNGKTLDDLYDNPPVFRLNRLERIERILGPVEIHAYEECVRDGIVPSFLRAIGAPDDLREAPSRNVSMTMEGARAFDEINRRGRKLKWRELDRIIGMPGEPFDIPEAVKERIAQDAREHVAFVNERYGRDDYPDIFEGR